MLSHFTQKSTSLRHSQSALFITRPVAFCLEIKQVGELQLDGVHIRLDLFLGEKRALVALPLGSPIIVVRHCQGDRHMPKALQSRQSHKRHQVTNMQAVGGGIEPL